MNTVIGFDNEKYIREQTGEILERVARFDNKLYLEFGGKLLYDYHAARVLPGYDPNVKMRLIRTLQEKDPANSLYLNCDEPSIRSSLSDRTSIGLRRLLGTKTLILIGEAQRVKNIGLNLKLLVGHLM